MGTPVTPMSGTPAENSEFLELTRRSEAGDGRLRAGVDAERPAGPES
jgi:hypothetical protein